MHRASPRSLRSNRRQFFGACLALPALAGRSAPAAAASSPAVDEVLSRLRAQQDAWNRGDIAGFCAHYAEDCVFLSPGGVSRGRKTVESRYSQKYGAAKASMGQLEFDILDRRSTSDTVSLAMRWTLRWPESPSPKPAASGLTLIIWQRHGSGWQLVQDASM